MYQVLDPVETSLGPAVVVGLPEEEAGMTEAGMIEIRLVESRECFVVKPEHLGSLVRRIPPPTYEGPAPAEATATMIYVLADDIDQPLIEVVRAAEARARRLHDMEERRYQEAVGGGDR